MSTSDVRIFDCVSEVLSENLGQTETQSYLQQIRQRYYNKHLPVKKYTSLDSTISNCRSCKEAEEKPVSGWWNWQDCDLLIVTANAYNDNKFSDSIAAFLKFTGFSSAFCGVVHITKCKFSEVQEKNINLCHHYVFDQIDVAKPKVIATIGNQAFNLFKTNQENYSSSIGDSWWWGIYKIYALPSFKNIEDDRWTEIFKRIHKEIYGEISDILDLT